MQKKKLLILNGSHSEIPLIKAGNNLGYHVITSGNQPALPGHQYADEYQFADFSDREAILQLASSLKIDAICSCANDFGALTAAYVSETLGLPGHDNFATCLLIHHKDLFKDYARQNQLPTPYAECFDEKRAALAAIDNISFPVLVKPVDLTGGKGISYVSDPGSYDSAVEKALQTSRAKRIVVEQYFEGSQHSFSTFLYKGKIVFQFSDNEYSFKNPYLVSTSAAPAVNIDFFSSELTAVVENLAATLNLVDGVIHVQYLARDDKYQILEITRRCSGDLYPLPVNLASGLDWASWIVRAETGMDCSDFPATRQRGFCGRHCIMAPRNGTLMDVKIDDAIRANIYEDLLWWAKGDRVDNYLVQKFGVLILKFSSMSEMLDKTGRINDLVEVIVEPV